MTRLVPVFGRVLLAIAMVLVGFPLLQGWARSIEIDISAGLLRLLGRSDQILALRHEIVLVSADGRVFAASLTPACSSIAAVIALIALASVIRTPPPGRRLAGLGAALAVVVLGNFVRIVGSLLVGLAYGRGSLVLFHDVVGATLTYIYILGGYIVMLAVMIEPRRRTAAGIRGLAHA